MTQRLFNALFVGLIISMILLYIINFPVAWVFFVFMFVTMYESLYFGVRGIPLAICYLIPSVAVLAIGAFALAPGLPAATWPAAGGTITGWDTCNNNRCLAYQYWVNGEQYTGHENDRVFSMGGLGSYRKGQEVTVHYDPQHPPVSRLVVVGFNLQAGLTALIGVVMTGLALAALGCALSDGQNGIPAAEWLTGMGKRRRY